MKKILFLLPAMTHSWSDTDRSIKYSRFPPLSLLTLAGLTPEDKYEMVVRDEHVESIDVEGVDLVAIQVYISSSHRAYAIADRYRARGAKVVMGGLHPTSLPNEAAAHADAVCIGPAETVWKDILHDFERGQMKQFYRGQSEGSACLTPLPRRDLINQNAYLLRNTMVVSRGCPHDCAFCYKSSFWGKNYYESRPLADIEKELATVKDGLVFFLDDNLLAKKPFCRELFKMLKGAGIIWQAAASLDVARSPDYLDLAFESGCRSLFMGFESISRSNMQDVGKSVNATTDYPETIRRIHDSGIMINSSFVFGFDHDDPDVFKRTLDFAITNKLETASVHILTPLPGTALFTQLEKEGRILHRNWSLYDIQHAVYQPKLMSPDQLEAGFWWFARTFRTNKRLLKRAVGSGGTIKRLAYTYALARSDKIWRFVIKTGLMPLARRVLRYTLNSGTRKQHAKRRRRQWWTRLLAGLRGLLQPAPHSSARATRGD